MFKEEKGMTSYVVVREEDGRGGRRNGSKEGHDKRCELAVELGVDSKCSGKSLRSFKQESDLVI